MGWMHGCMNKEVPAFQSIFWYFNFDDITRFDSRIIYHLYKLNLDDTYSAVFKKPNASRHQ